MDFTEKTRSKSSQIFCPFRAVGFVSNHVPLDLQVRGPESYVTTVIGNSFHIYDVRDEDDYVYCIFYFTCKLEDIRIPYLPFPCTEFSFSQSNIFSKAVE